MDLAVSTVNRKTQIRREKRKDMLGIFLMLFPYVLLFSIFIAIPVALAVYLSMTSFNMIETPKFTGLANFVTIFTQDSVFLKYVLPKTLMYSIIVGPGGYILSFILAWMLAQIQKFPRTLMTLALYLPSMVGGVLISVIWRTLFSGDSSGYLNSVLLRLNIIERPIQFLQSPDYLMTIVILVSLWSAMGVGFLAMLAGILNGNQELYEAAYVEGIKTKFQEIRYVTIPMMKPQMLFGGVMSIVATFTNGYIGVALSGTNPTPQYSAQFIINHIDDYGFLRYEMGYAAALSVILLILILIFSKVAYKLFGEKE